MRPSGDGERERSRKLSDILVGDRKPLEALPFDGGEAGIMGFDRRLGRRCRDAELGVESDPVMFSGASGCRCRRDADRVTGVR